MIIEQVQKKIKGFREKSSGDPIKSAGWLIFMLLLAFLSFGLGRLSAVEDNTESVVVSSAQNRIFTPEAEQKTKNTASAADSAAEGKFVASKNGTRFYLPWCGGVSRINEENKIWFTTEAQARARGLTPAKNCDGI